jgi:AcrR family transcriptional regulator
VSQDSPANLENALDGASLDLIAVTAKRRAAKARPIEDVAERLSSSAIALFSEHGFDAVTVSDIARAAGVTPRTFFRYFPTKETVIIDIQDQTNVRLVDLIEHVPPQADTLQLVGTLLRTWLDEYEPVQRATMRLISDSESLRATLLFRTTEWERRLGDALRTRFPHLTEEQSHLLAGSLFLFMRLSLETADLDDSPYSTTCDRLVDQFRTVLATDVATPVPDTVS